MWRVSTILKLEGISTPFHFSPEAARRGVAVHKAAEAMAAGRRPTNSEETAPYVAALARWFDDFAPIIVFSERRVASRDLRLTGRMDLGVVIKDKPMIVDVKSSDGTSAWHGMQVCAYQDLANSDPETRELLAAHARGPWQRAILYLRSNGKYDWRGPLDLLARGPHDAQLFRAAHMLVAWKYDHGMITTIDAENPDDVAA